MKFRNRAGTKRPAAKILFCAGLSKNPFGLFAAFRIAKSIFAACFCNSAAAAGDQARKGTLTVSFPTFLPSETFG
jgi:hypothetical protein